MKSKKTASTEGPLLIDTQGEEMPASSQAAVAEVVTPHAEEDSGEDSGEDSDEDDESDEELGPELEDPEFGELSGESDLVNSEAEEPEQRATRSRKTTSLAKSTSSSLAKVDPLQAYMNEVGRHSLLTPEEEKDLALRYFEQEDLEAAARLVTSNLRLVVKLAFEYRRAYKNMMDLIQEGNMGLMQAVKKFDPYRGVKLSSYAAWWIRAYMLRYILANARLVKVGTTQAQRKLFFNLNKEKQRLSAMGIEPSHAEIAKSLDVSVKEVEEMDKRLSRGDASLDLPVNEGEGRQIARVELMEGDSDNPESVVQGAEMAELVKKYLDEFKKDLKDKDLIIFQERMVAEDPRTLQDLGDQFGISRERVRQLEARITKNLRVYLSDRLGDAVEMN